MRTLDFICHESRHSNRLLSSLATVFLFLFLLPAIHASAAQTVKIMPLGDSITDGTGSIDSSGYRRYLYHLLGDAGYQFEFVGGRTDGPYDYDRDHEGHSGYITRQIFNNLYGTNGNWLGRNPADVILLHIGTNDILQRVVDINEVEKVLDRVDRFERDSGRTVFVVLAKIILGNPAWNNNDDIMAFNDAIGALANRRISSGDKLVLVDMESVVDYPRDFDDSIHPDDSGYQKMAAVWFDAIQDILPEPDAPNIRLIPQDFWRVTYVDSEEVDGENGSADNAIDGSANTIWHTAWTVTLDALPHEIQIDLGLSHSVAGFRYLPRQNSENGRIGTFRFYLSQDGASWGQPVARGDLQNTGREQTVTFSPGMARFVRLVATSEVNGNPFSSIAEFNLLESESSIAGILEAARTPTAVTDAWYDVSFRNSFIGSPVLLTAMQTTNGENTAGLGVRDLGTSGFQVMIEEEQSLDDETRHKEERVGYAALTPGLLLDDLGNVIGESGSLVEAQPSASQWHRVTLAGDYDRPVVVMNLNSRSGSQPCHIRLRNVQGRSFEFQIEEWDYLDQTHRKETISFLVVESGAHTLSGGTLVEADRIQIDHSWEAVLFRSPFDASPVVFSQPQTENGATAIVTRQRDIGPDGLEIRVQEEEAKNGLHKTEIIGYIVIER